MDNQNGGVGEVVGNVVLGVGFVSMILAPIYLMWRFGLAQMTAGMAPFVTLVAFYRKDWLAGMGDSHGLLREYLSLPWTGIAVLFWCATFLCLAAVAFDLMPMWFAGAKRRQSDNQ